MGNEKPIRRPKLCKRTKEQKDYDVKLAAKLFLRGYTYRDITSLLNKDIKDRGLDYKLDSTQVFKDIKKEMVEWKRESLESIDKYMDKELRKLDALEVEAWEGWEKSKQGKQRDKKRSSARPKKVLLEEEKTTDYFGYEEKTVEMSAGNPRFIEVILNIHQRRAKLLGLEAPIKVDIPGYSKDAETEKPKYDIDAIPDDILYNVVDRLQSAEYQKVITTKYEA